MKSLRFTKMQGLGNDFVVFEGPLLLEGAEIAWLCDRRRGVGADGVLVVTAGDPVRMEYWNADGSPAEMCGNGLRCVARYAYDKGWARDRNFSVQTPMGERGVRVLEDRIEAELGRPVTSGSRDIDGAEYEMVSVGNPHAVTFVTDPAATDIDVIARGLQSQFPDGVNVEFVRVVDGSVEMRVWERGVGETLACGTGMAAAATAALSRSDVTTPLSVKVPGGEASIDFRDGVAWIAGPADYSFTGNVGER